MGTIRKILSGGLLSIYLLSIVGAACAVLSCKCVHFDSSYTSHSCCSCCCGDCSDGKMTLQTEGGVACCKHDHSNDSALYITNLGERQSLQKVVITLPDAMVEVESQPTLLAVANCSESFAPPLDIASEEVVALGSLRAPPALV